MWSGCKDRDDNIGFFHETIKNNNKVFENQWCTAILVNGVWEVDPVAIKQHIFDHFQVRFSEDMQDGPYFESNSFKRLSVEMANDFIKPFSVDEIRYIVLNCGGDNPRVWVASILISLKKFGSYSNPIWRMCLIIIMQVNLSLLGVMRRLLPLFGSC